MKFEDYRDRYQTIRLTRGGDGVLELVMHTRGGEALWGTSLTSLHAELGECFADMARDPENKVVIMTGTGDNFVVGFDAEESAPEGDDRAAVWRRIHVEGMALLNNLLAIPVPVIAAVNGPAHIHAELLVLGDIVLAADHAEFADLAHVPNGVVPGDGVQTVWQELLGPNRGRYFLLTGERIDAREAQRLGIVGEVLPRDGLMDRARELARQLAANPHWTLRQMKSVLVRRLRRRVAEDLDHGLAVEALATLTG
ncbi:MAG: enoyl-CoA hydratase/isomerase family protein [Novosphingobium sp.]|nr:enoyl-CoA hydratase/isomerase family protein [Novosphingobium sp.]